MSIRRHAVQIDIQNEPAVPPLTAFHEPRWGSRRLGHARDWERARVRASLAAGRSILIVGELGFGRTHMARAAVGDPLRPGDRVLTCTAETTAEEIRARDARVGIRPLAFDDVHLLEPAAFEAVLARVRRGAPTVLTAVAPSGGGAPGERVRRLEREALVEHIDLGGLEDDELSAIVAEAVHPLVLDTLRMSTILDLAAGSPHRARELAFGATRADSPLYAADRHPLLNPVTLSARLAQAALANLPDVDPEPAAAAIVLHELGPQPRPTVVRLVGAAITERLERLRLLREIGGRRHMGVDVLAVEALRLRPEVLALAEPLRETVFDELWRQWRLALPFEESAELFLGMMFLTRPARAEGEEADAVADLLCRAAAHAGRRGAFLYAESFARESLLARVSADAWTELARALIGQRRYQEARDVLGRSEPDGLDDRGRIDLLHTRMLLDGRLGRLSTETSELYARLRADSSHAVARHAELIGFWGGVEEVTMEAARFVEGIVADPDAAETTRLRASIMLCVLLVDGRDPERLARALSTGLSLYARVRGRRGASRYLFEHDAPGLFLLFAECSRLVTGVPVPGLLEALDDLRARVRDPEIETSSNERVAVLYAEGLRAFIRGELPFAAAELRAAGEQLTPVVPTPVSALLNLLHTAVYTEPVGGVAPDRRKGLYPIEVLPEGWRGIYGGMFRAIGLEGETPPETAWLRLTARYFDGLYRGELAGLAESLDASERALAYPRTSAMLAHIDATASEDPEALVGAGESLEACNMYASAVFAYEQARAIFQERRLTARVTACARAASEAAAHLRTPPPPIPDGLVAGPTPLTPREREICELIAEGLRNHEIAQRLFLSVRTVESHVLSARGKLGAARRSDIPELLYARR